MKKYDELVEKIKNHTLGNKEEATALYFAFCACLKEKYGLVDRDFDDNPIINILFLFPLDCAGFRLRFFFILFHER